MKDFFGKDVSELLNKELWLFDMDGTIYEGDRLFDGTLDLLKAITDRGGKYIFITNNSSKSVYDYVNKVNKMGIEAGKEEFFTSAQATIMYLKQEYPGAKVYCQGTRSLVQELSEAGIEVTEEVEQVDVVLVGYDTELTYEKLQRTCDILGHQDVAYIATNPDWVCPSERGFIPDCGSICGMIEHTVGKKPTYIGKPEPTMVNTVMEKFAMSSDKTVVVGDRLYTDIATGINAGVATICVLTGEATVEDIADGGTKPTYTFDSVKDIAYLLENF